MDDLDHSVFAVDRHHMEFEIQDSKIAKGSHEDPPDKFQGYDQALGRKAIQESTPNAYRQANCVSDFRVLQH